MLAPTFPKRTIIIYNMEFKHLLLFHALFMKGKNIGKERKDTGKKGEMACLHHGWGDGR